MTSGYVCSKYLMMNVLSATQFLPCQIIGSCEGNAGRQHLNAEQGTLLCQHGLAQASRNGYPSSAEQKNALGQSVWGKATGRTECTRPHAEAPEATLL
jgi:hypothetical protein